MKRVLFYSLVLFLSLAWFGGSRYYSEHASQIYENRGNNYYKEQQYNKAIASYEKAIKAGNKNGNLRRTYVNLLIQSGMSISTQEQLAQIASDGIEDYASNNAKEYLYELKKEIHDKYPLNYILQAPQNQKILHWGKFPVTYAFKNVSSVPAIYGYEIMNAFKEWEKSGFIKFEYTKQADANIIIEFIHNPIKDVDEGQKYVIAYTTPIIHQNNLSQMIVKFNIKDIRGELYSPTQIYNTALHEIFHALGYMGHSYNKDNIMYMSRDNEFENYNKRALLNEADKSTLELLYKIKPDITNVQELSYEYIPYLVLGSNDEINNYKVREAKHYIQKAPELSSGYVDLAESLVAKQRYVDAIKILERALNLASNTDEQYIITYNLAVCYYYIANYDMSQMYVDSAMKMKDVEELHLLQAEIYVKQNSTLKAIDEYNSLVKIAPDNINYVINLANLYISKHSYLSARSVLKNYIKLHPEEKKNELFKPYGILML